MDVPVVGSGASRNYLGEILHHLLRLSHSSTAFRSFPPTGTSLCYELETSVNNEGSWLFMGELLVFGSC